MKMSETIGKLAEALASAQAEMEGARKAARNPLSNSSYADLGAIWAAIREPLSRNGLAVIQLQTTGSIEDAFVEVETALVHASGEWVSGTLRMPVAGAVNNSLQAFGAALTYARRYGLQAMVGIAAVGDGADGPGEGKRAENREPRGKEGVEVPPRSGENGSPAAGVFVGATSGYDRDPERFGSDISESAGGGFLHQAQEDILGIASVAGLNAWADNYRKEIAFLPEGERAGLREMFTARRNELSPGL